MTRDGKLRIHQEAGARLSGVMGKGKGEAWAPATIFISHIVILSRLDATLALTDSTCSGVSSSISSLCATAVNSPQQARLGAVAQSGERRLCTAEVRGSNPLGSTPKSPANDGKNEEH